MFWVHCVSIREIIAPSAAPSYISHEWMGLEKVKALVNLRIVSCKKKFCTLIIKAHYRTFQWPCKLRSFLVRTSICMLKVRSGQIVFLIMGLAQTFLWSIQIQFEYIKKYNSEVQVGSSWNVQDTLPQKWGVWLSAPLKLQSKFPWGRLQRQKISMLG